MTILALEFSSARRSVALAFAEPELPVSGQSAASAQRRLARGGVVLAEAAVQTDARGTDAFGLIEKVLAEAKILRQEIDVVAVGLGPGSYTGIRAAIAVAQGWQLATGVKLLGVSSADALAAQAQAEKIFGRVNVVIDAQRGEFYLSTWEISAVERKEISPLKIVSGAEKLARENAGEICVGPEAARLIFPSAAVIARLAEGRSDFTAGEKLEPIYLRETSFVKAPPVGKF
jgi:tRNA threonylcarbamoyladenosine biosynthesis protein TsaB